VLDKKVAIIVNDTLFLHGGISGFYCRNSLESITEMAHARLRSFDPMNPGILEDPFGPLWYRGLSGVEPHAEEATVSAILDHHGIKRIVVGHTPTSGIVWPRYDGRVVVIDTGIAQAYGGYVAYLEITPEGVFAGYPQGRLPLPESDEGVVSYLQEVIAMTPENAQLQARLERLTQPPPEVPEGAEGEAAADQSDAEAAAALAEPIPICASRGT
jgi:hypothetical protein